MYTNNTEQLSHRELQNRLNKSFPRNSPPDGWTIYEAPPPPEPTDEQIKQRLTNAVQRHLDETARERDYDGILSLCTYATSTDPKFAAEGQAGVEWRDTVWAECYRLLGQVESGEIEPPSEAELIDALPVFEWPSA